MQLYLNSPSSLSATSFCTSSIKTCIHSQSRNTHTTPNQSNQTASLSFSGHTSDHTQSLTSTSAFQCSLFHAASLRLSHSSGNTAPKPYIPYLSLALLPSVFILFHTASLCIFLTVVTTQPPTHISLACCFPSVLSFTLTLVTPVSLPPTLSLLCHFPVYSLSLIHAVSLSCLSHMRPVVVNQPILVTNVSPFISVMKTACGNDGCP